MPAFRWEAGLNRIRKELLEVLSLIVFHALDPTSRVVRRQPLGARVLLNREAMPRGHFLPLFPVFNPNAASKGRR